MPQIAPCRRYFLLLSALLLCAALLAQDGSPSLHAQQPDILRVAAAADLTSVLPALAAEYEKQTGVRLVASFSSSANLTEQIRAGAPFDVFLSADTLHPRMIVEGGQALSAAPVPYARGTLVLWARHDSPAQPLSLRSLESPAVTRIAIANPAHAPYGLAARQYLEHEHLWNTLQSRLVTAENISQAAQFADSGNAQLGIISLTTARTAHFAQTGSYIAVPPGSYEPIRQAAIVIKASRNAAAAQHFLDWLTSPPVQQHLRDFGLEPAP